MGRMILLNVLRVSFWDARATERVIVVAADVMVAKATGGEF
jgi:hypothetical protein